MALPVETLQAAVQPAPVGRRRLQMNWKLTAGLVLVLAPLLAGLAAPLLASAQAYRVGAYMPNLTPSASHLLGTDTTGRDLLAELLYSILPTLEIGVLAGVLGTLLGVALGLVSGYVRGLPDALLRTVADVMLGVPSLAVLVVLAAFLGSSSIAELALIIATFSWMGAARSIRAQVLSLRDQSYVLVSRLSGRTAIEIMFLELLPNLLPLVMAGLVGAVSGAMLGAVGLQLLGLGPIATPTLGLMLQTSFGAGALVQGMWWWWGPPTMVLTLIFVALLLISMALDEIANPRLQGAAG
jgi:peptide/nickel transport system permease protein